VVVITKGSAAAVTLADPTATVDDGKELLIVSTAFAAHASRNDAGSASTPAAPASDVGTFGGAKGDSIGSSRTRASGTCSTKTNVTLA
jgi:hypothetical protein